MVSCGGVGLTVGMKRNELERITKKDCDELNRKSVKLSESWEKENGLRDRNRQKPTDVTDPTRLVYSPQRSNQPEPKSHPTVCPRILAPKSELSAQQVVAPGQAGSPNLRSAAAVQHVCRFQEWSTVAIFTLECVMRYAMIMR